MHTEPIFLKRVKRSIAVVIGLGLLLEAAAPRVDAMSCSVLPVASPSKRLFTPEALAGRLASARLTLASARGKNIGRLAVLYATGLSLVSGAKETLKRARPERTGHREQGGRMKPELILSIAAHAVAVVAVLAWVREPVNLIAAAFLVGYWVFSRRVDARRATMEETAARLVFNLTEDREHKLDLLRQFPHLRRREETKWFLVEQFSPHHRDSLFFHHSADEVAHLLAALETTDPELNTARLSVLVKAHEAAQILGRPSIAFSQALHRFLVDPHAVRILATLFISERDAAMRLALLRLLGESAVIPELRGDARFREALHRSATDRENGLFAQYVLVKMDSPYARLASFVARLTAGRWRGSRTPLVLMSLALATLSVRPLQTPSHRLTTGSAA